MKRRKRRACDELKRLSVNIRGEILRDGGTCTLKVDNTIGAGEVRCVNFDDGLYVLEFDLELKEDIYLSLLSENDNSIYFFYCFKGDCFYAAQHNNHFVRLDELQTAIVKTNRNFAGGMVLKEASKINLNILRIDSDAYFEKHAKNPTIIAQKFKAFLTDLNRRHNLVHLGKMNLEIGNYIQKLSKAKYAETLPELLYFEGICILILASHIEQYKRETNGITNPTKLIKREMQKVMETADMITNNPEKQYTVTSLCSLSGLSAAKMQEGFKFLYQRTVADFIRNARLEMAERLIKQTDMNISEVVYSVGLTSRSYFCKIFKEKYNCNPKDYKSKQNIGALHGNI